MCLILVWVVCLHLQKMSLQTYKDLCTAMHISNKAPNICKIFWFPSAHILFQGVINARRWNRSPFIKHVGFVQFESSFKTGGVNVFSVMGKLLCVYMAGSSLSKNRNYGWCVTEKNPEYTSASWSDRQKYTRLLYNANLLRINLIFSM